MRLGRVQKKLFELALQFPPDHAMLRVWKENGFVVEGDEIEDLERTLEEGFDNYPASTDKVLRLTLHATSLCNFACPYCFQDRRTAHMSPEVQDAIVRYVEAKLASGGYERMTVGWFGGEPLLAADVIRSLGTRLMEVAAAHNAGFSSNIHTNGYLLTQETVDLLESLNCKFVLVTLDGYGKAHDKTRHLHGGVATFDRIIQNLTDIRTSMIVNVRSNLHEGNADTYDELRELIQEIARKTGNEMRCSPVPVHPCESSVKRGDTTKTLDADTYEKIKATTDLEARMSSFEPKLFACPAGQPDNYTIDDEGYLFTHCNELAVNRARAYCNVLELDETNFDLPDRTHKELALRYTLPRESKRCMDCTFLPTCYGGCLLSRFATKSEFRCNRTKHAADAFVLDKYRKATSDVGAKEETHID